METMNLNLNLMNACMLLEIAGEEGLAEKYGLNRSECIWSAHSYIQNLMNGHPVSDCAKELIAKIVADSAIENMVYKGED
tara:strand:+ start:534 stop:773 length:240 start_codon:yes stop_codon:yes gene_type:complete